MNVLDSFPILLVDDELLDDTAVGRATRAVVEQLRDDGVRVITATATDDAEQVIASTASLSCVLIDWDVHHAADATLPASGPDGRTDAGDGSLENGAARSRALVQQVRSHNRRVPVFILADRSAITELPADVLRTITGYVWKLEDTPAFIASRVEEARREYLEPLLPPFFGALVQFVQAGRYSWHTPGHSGGAAFRKTPVGWAFHEFFGENALRSDLSVSVSELGSLLEHTGPVGAAETEAARIFGADRTMFVTNGTSTANKIVFHACVQPGDVVLVDRNCHKSVMHAIVMTGAVPVYLHPLRNAYGIIGPIPPTALSADTVRASIAANPLVPHGMLTAALAVVTNSTYDGLCYDAGAVLSALSETSRRVLFDEAWFGYAHFHSLYAGRHAMGVNRRPEQPATFATQSTHKLLAAFSQGSMIHFHDSDHSVSQAALEEAFMMHTSTSPQYGIIASLDIAAAMMDGPQGTSLVSEAIGEAIEFRRQLSRIAADRSPDDWAFAVWQPDATEDAPEPEHWVLRDGEEWHGYRGLGESHAMLDPIKVTILTPGITADGSLAQDGIPAALVSRFLDERGIVVEKTGSYSFLVLFSLGITKGKSGTLLTELLEFKRLYDADAPLRDALPRLVTEHPRRYGTLTLRELADELHTSLRSADVTELTDAAYSQLPTPASTPAEAYRQLVRGTVEMVGPSELAGRISAAMLVPYPPGIPMIMPGERFGAPDSALIRYLATSEQLAARFPGFETEIHGIQIDDVGTYRVPCVSGT